MLVFRFPLVSAWVLGVRHLFSRPELLSSVELLGFALRLVVSDRFRTLGRALRHKFPGDWPESLLSAVSTLLILIRFCCAVVSLSCQTTCADALHHAFCHLLVIVRTRRVEAWLVAHP